MKRKPLSLLLALALAFTLALAGCGGSGGTLKVGVRGDIVNFGYENPENGRRDGLDIDLANELAKRLGYGKVDFVTVDSTTREQFLQDGTVDVVAAAYSITPERQEVVDFSPAYYEDAMKVMVEDTTGFTTLKDLKGTVVAVLKDSNNALALCQKMAELGLIPAFDETAFDPAAFNGGLTFAIYDSYDAMDDALETGEADAMCGDGALLQGHKWSSRLYLEETFHADSYGVATKKGSALSAKVSAAVQAMLDDGTIATMIDKWN